MSIRAPPATGARLDVLVARVVRLPPGEAEEQPPGIEPDGEPSSLSPRGRATAGRIRSREAVLGRHASDERLLELAGLGDERAWEALMGRHQAYLHACCRPIVGESSAQDAVQQAFVSAWHALLRGCEVRNVRAWLATIARRAALQMLREEGPREQPPPGWAAAEQQAPDQHELFARARAALAAVAALPAHERDALVWTSLQGRSTRETASALGVSEGALRQLVFRARARARAAVGGMLPSTLLDRIYGLIAHGTRRIGGGLRSELSGRLALHAGDGLTRLAPALAAAVLVGAPLATLDLASPGARHARKAPAQAGSRDVPSQRQRLGPAHPRGHGATTRTRAAAPARAAPARKAATSAGAQAYGPPLRLLPGTPGASAAAAADAPPAAAAQRSSSAQSGVPPTITDRVPAAPAAPSALPAAAPASAPALPLPSVTGVNQQLGNAAGQAGATTTAGTGALLEAGRTVGAAATSALPATPSLP